MWDDRTRQKRDSAQQEIKNLRWQAAQDSDLADMYEENVKRLRKRASGFERKAQKISDKWGFAT